MKPILLLGATGQVGWELKRALSPLAPLVTPDRATLDVGHAESIRNTIATVQPRLIVNAAAYTPVDRAEQEPNAAALVNAEAPRVLAESAKARGIPLVHYSTDYVFAGDKAAPYVETDATAPLSCYGRTKLAGERAVQEAAGFGVILRTSWVFGEVGANFVRTILSLAAEEATLRVVDDQIGAPTPAALVADVTAHVIRTFDSEGWTSPRVYHVAAAGDLSWHAFARIIVSKALQLGMKLRLTPEAIEAIPSEAYPTAARRPKNSRLDCTALGARFSLVLPEWDRYLERVLLRYAARP